MSLDRHHSTSDIHCGHDGEAIRLRDRLDLMTRENALLVSERDIARRRVSELERELAKVWARTPRSEPQAQCAGFASRNPAAPGPRCCDRAGTYNGLGSDGPTAFTCPRSCACHD